MSEFKVAFIFVLAVVGWFGYAIERENRKRLELRIKKFYGEECNEKKKFLPNINAADAKVILEKKVKGSVSATLRILANRVTKAASWLSLRRRSMMELSSINNEE